MALDGASVKAKALLDNASSASFVSEWLVQSLNLPLVYQKNHVIGILSPVFRSLQHIVMTKKINCTAIVVSRALRQIEMIRVFNRVSWQNH